MYGYRKQNENTLMTNLNSISSSLSSIDTIGLRANNTKASVDNLIEPKTHSSIASASLLWRTGAGSKQDGRYAAIRAANGFGGRQVGSEIYHDRSNRSLKKTCFNAEAALNCTLVPLILLTITRQVFDFLGQMWLQIIINFFTTIWLIFAFFGIKQRRISYLILYSLWAIFGTVWNYFVFCIYSKTKDVGLTEDALSLFTGATSWWNSHGPGCLPYNINAIQPPISMLQPHIITGCRIDYHLLEATQAAIHLLLSLVSFLVCCCLIISIRRYPTYFGATSNQSKSDKPYRLNNLMIDRQSKVNQNPSPDHGTSSRFVANSTNASLRRATNKTSTRGSQSSMRSARRRTRQTSGDGIALPTPRGSTSSVQRSQKYGSLSSRRSSKTRADRRGEVSSLTYGATGPASSSQRTRLSSLSSNDYLPSYQPPHSSNTNLLSSYGEISSVDSYNDRTNGNHNHKTKNRQSFTRPGPSKGNTNPTFTGSKSSVCSYGTSTNPNNNYDDLSYIYGNSSTKNSESFYGAGAEVARHRQQIYQQHKADQANKRNGLKGAGHRNQNIEPKKIQAETYEQRNRMVMSSNGDTMTKTTLGMTNGSFHSFSTNSNNYQQYSMNPDGGNNNVENQYGVKYQEDKRGGNHHLPASTSSNGGHSTQFEARSQTGDSSMLLTAVTNNQRQSRYPIYSNHHMVNGNSETPI